MLSSKLKLWVETHLTRNGKKKNKTKKSSAKAGDRIACSPKTVINSEAEKIPSLSLPVPNSAGRSNAALVMQLQHDMATNPCWKHSQLANSPLISWKNEHQQQLLDDKDDYIYETPCSVFSKTNPDLNRQSSSGSSGSSGLSEPNYPLSKKTPSSLSSPESAYSTGCSTDISPTSQEAGIESQKLSWNAQSKFDDPEKMGPYPFSPRPRSSIRTNPWVPLKKYPHSRLSTGDSGTETSSGNFTENESRSSLSVSHTVLSSVKETDILSDGEIVPPKNEVPCSSFELLMEGDQLQIITKQVSEAYKSSNMNEQPSSVMKKQSKPWDKDIDDRYTALIQETEEILNQLENDELFLLQRVQENQAEIRKKSAAFNRATRQRGKKLPSRRLNRSMVETSSSDSESDYQDSPEGSFRLNARPKYSHRHRDQRTRSIRLTRLNDEDLVNRFAGQSDLTRTLFTEYTEENRPPSPAPVDITLLQSRYRGYRNHPRKCNRYGQYYDTLHSNGVLSKANRNISSCPGSPATFWQEDFISRRRSSRYPSHERGLASDTDSDPARDWREQKRLEEEVAYLQQQLLQSSSGNLNHVRNNFVDRQMTFSPQQTYGFAKSLDFRPL